MIFALFLAAALATGGDTCERAEEVTVGTVDIDMESFSPCDNSEEHCPSCLMESDAWFVVTAPCTGTLTVDACGLDGDAMLGVFLGDASACSELDGVDNEASNSFGSCDDYGCANDVGELATIEVETGDAVLIRIGQYFDEEEVVSGSMVISCLAEGEKPPAPPVPENDVCTGALMVEEGETRISNLHATTCDPDEESCSRCSMEDDVWLSVVPSCTGTLVVSTCNLGVDTMLGLFDGGCTAVDRATSKASNDESESCDDFGCKVEGGESARMAVTAGAPVLIQVGSFDSGDVFDGNIVISCEIRKPSSVGHDNDVCTDARLVEEGVVSVSNVGATTCNEAEEECPDCDTQNDIWLKVVPSCTGYLVVSTCETAVDTTLGIFDASCASLNGEASIASNDVEGTCDDFGCPFAGGEVAHALVTAGVPVVIQLGSFEEDDVFSGDISILCATGIDHDTCATAAEIEEGSHFVTNAGDTTTCDTAAGDVCTACDARGAEYDVWLKVEASCTGQLSVDACGLDFTDTTLGLFKAADCAEIRGADNGVTNDPDGSCDDYGCSSSGGEFGVIDVTQGDIVFIQLGSYDASEDPFAGVIHVTCDVAAPTPAPTPGPPRHPNDVCDDAFVIFEGVTRIDASGATPCNPADESCPECYIDNDIWLIVEATCNGVLTVDVCGFEQDTMLSVFGTDDCALEDAINEATNVGSGECDDYGCSSGFGEKASIIVEEGQHVLIRLGSYRDDFIAGEFAAGDVVVECGKERVHPNDVCVDAEQVTEGTVAVDNADATTCDDDVETCGTCDMLDDIWMYVEASCTGLLEVDACSIAEDTMLAVYDSACDDIVQNDATTDVEKTCDDYFCPTSGGETARINVVEGQRILIQLGSFDFETHIVGNLVIKCFASTSTTADGVTTTSSGGATTSSGVTTTSSGVTTTSVEATTTIGTTTTSSGATTTAATTVPTTVSGFTKTSAPSTTTNVVPTTTASPSPTTTIKMRHTKAPKKTSPKTNIETMAQRTTSMIFSAGGTLTSKAIEVTASSTATARETSAVSEVGLTAIKTTVEGTFESTSTTLPTEPANLAPVVVAVDHASIKTMAPIAVLMALFRFF